MNKDKVGLLHKNAFSTYCRKMFHTLFFFPKTNTSIEAFNTLNLCHERGKAEDDIGFREVTISYVTLSCSQY